MSFITVQRQTFGMETTIAHWSERHSKDMFQFFGCFLSIAQMRTLRETLRGQHYRLHRNMDNLYENCSGASQARRRYKGPGRP